MDWPRDATEYIRRVFMSKWPSLLLGGSDGPSQPRGEHFHAPLWQQRGHDGQTDHCGGHPEPTLNHLGGQGEDAMPGTSKA